MVFFLACLEMYNSSHNARAAVRLQEFRSAMLLPPNANGIELYWRSTSTYYVVVENGIPQQCNDVPTC